MVRKRTNNKKRTRRRIRSRATQAAKPAGPSTVPFCLMAKPIGPICNLHCTYCFYLEKEALFSDSRTFRMSDDVLEAFIRKYIESQPSKEVQFPWQGGEPMLMGLDFFRKALQLQRQYAQGKRISNSLQTNGTLLDDQWARFLSDNNWLVGLSLDGPREIHDGYRLDARGQGSFDKVMHGLEVLKKHGVEFNVLACVTAANSGRPLEVYRFLKDVGVRFVQFMPIVERLPDDKANQLGLKLAVPVRRGQDVQTVQMTPWSVQPQAYGDFMIRIFDEWVRNDVGSFVVMNFEWALSNYLGQPAGLCRWMPRCGRSPIIEHNGDVYACDHYVYPQYRLGNILTDDLQEMMQSVEQRRFGDAKFDALPRYCRKCPVGPTCWGGCPKRRFLASPDGEPGLNYLCSGYRKFFVHTAPYFEAISRLMQSGQPVSKIMESEILVPKI